MKSNFQPKIKEKIFVVHIFSLGGITQAGMQNNFLKNYEATDTTKNVAMKISP
jgi:hypothetical protein